MWYMTKKDSGLFPADSLFDRVFGKGLLDEWSDTNSMFNVDIAEEGNEIHIKCELPGVKKEDLSVHYEEGTLTISAKKEESFEENEKPKLLRKEISYGEVSRSFSVGVVDPENIKASYKDGILNVTLKRQVEKENFKKIDIS